MDCGVFSVQFVVTEPVGALQDGTHPPAHLQRIDDVEIASLEYVDWFNHRRLHSACNMTPPAEFEQHYYAHLRASQLVQTP